MEHGGAEVWDEVLEHKGGHMLEDDTFGEGAAEDEEVAEENKQTFDMDDEANSHDDEASDFELEPGFWELGADHLHSCSIDSVQLQLRATTVHPARTALRTRMMVRPSHEADHTSGQEPLPLLVYFNGLGNTDPITEIKQHREMFSGVTPVPFILVEPVRLGSHWWVLDSSSTNGWLDGELDETVAEALAGLIRKLAAFDGVDADRVALAGFSAGSYACTELLTRRLPRLCAVVMGGLHGHGTPEPQADQVGKKRSKWKVEEKFAKYLERLALHKGVPFFEAAHSKGDQMCRWANAQKILNALDAAQSRAGMPQVRRRIIEDEEQDQMPGRKKNKSRHCYIKATFARVDLLCSIFQQGTPTARCRKSVVQMDDPPLRPPRKRPRQEACGSTLMDALAPEQSTEFIDDVEDYVVSMLDPTWADTALDLFTEHGFVVVTGVLERHEYASVLSECRKIEGKIVLPAKRGNRDPGRYSIGNASDNSAIHLPSFARHLVGSGVRKLLPVLEKIFASPEDDGTMQPFHVVSAGGDFVLGGTRAYQKLHADAYFKKSMNGHMPPPKVSVNFAVSDICVENGPMRILPGQIACNGNPAVHRNHPIETESEVSKQSTLCPLNAGTAIIRDIRVLHGGTPNKSTKTRFLPAVLLASGPVRDRYHSQPDKSYLMPEDLFDELPEEVKPLCSGLVGSINAEDVVWRSC